MRRNKKNKSKKPSRRLPRLCACALTGALLVVPVLADTVGGATVSVGTGLNLRAEPTTESAATTVIPDGAFLLVEEKLDGWYKVVYNGRSGYVSADYAVFSETLEGAYEFTGTTAGSAVNLRSGAGTGSAVRKCLWSAGTPLRITGVSGGWLKVRDAAGTDGYVRSDLLSYSGVEAEGPRAFADDSPADVAATVGEQLVATAKQYLGYPYCWAGSSPSTGFDCSGFTGYIYGLYGYSLSRIAHSIYVYDGVSVSTDELRPGDVLCFGYGGYVGHVGIYVGDGQFIHASSYDTGVILSDLWGHYGGQLLGAKRIIT